MRFIYSLLFYLSVPLIGARLLWRARRNRAYLKRWSERFGKIPFYPHQNGIWWHSVSMGETLAAIPLIRLFQQKHPDISVLVTTMTPSGSAQVVKNLGDKIQHMYIPYDLPHVMARFIERIRPRLVVIIETELWPNMLFYCKQQQVPVLLANARLSEQSARGYARFSSLTQKMFHCITRMAVQNYDDAERFIQLGFPRERIQVTGTVKFDVTIPDELFLKADQLRTQWGKDRPVWIAASTHAGEEEIILEAAKKIPQALLILAPRHPDRTAEVLSFCEKAKLRTCLRSTGELPTNDTEIFLIDTLGELLLFYAVSDIAFIGGSLVPKGGHNLLEPAALGLAILSGEYLYNFAEVERLLEAAHALIKVNNAKSLSEKINLLFQDADKRYQMATAAKNVVLQNRGATEKHLLLIDEMLFKSS